MSMSGGRRLLKLSSNRYWPLNWSALTVSLSVCLSLTH